MKKGIIVYAAVILTATALAADVEYEYPAEYADLFEQFRPLTPEEAQMMVSARGIPLWENSAGSVILEPIAIKCKNGSPGFYWVLSHKTDDPHLRKAAENIISMVNDEKGFDPYEFVKECEALKEHRNDFCTFYIDAWTWNWAIRGQSGIMNVYDVNEFANYLSLAEKNFGKGNIIRAKIYTASVRPSSPIIAFEVRDGTIHYLYGTTGDVTVVDEEAVREMAREGVEEAYTHFKTHPDAWDEAETKWTETLEYINREAIKEDGNYKVRGSAESMEIDGTKVNNVPDMNSHRTGPSGVCWRWTMTSILTFWSQKRKLKLIENVTIPPPGENQSTTNYGYKVFQEIGRYILTHVEWLHLYFAGAYPHESVDLADDFTKYCGYTEENNNTFYYVCWDMNTGTIKNTITYYTQYLKWSGITTAIHGGLPLYTRWDFHPFRRTRHAVPTIGYTTSGGNILRTWNMIGDEYDEELCQYPPDNEKNHIWGWIAEPEKNGSGDPWVDNFVVERRRASAELTWSVTETSDVKGFYVYREGGDGVSRRVNTEIITPGKEDRFHYEYVDKGYTKGSRYVLELVRHTEDEVPYLVHE